MRWINPCALLFVLAACIPALHAQEPASGADPNWAALPDGMRWGQVVAVDVDADGNIFALHRCGSDTCVDQRVPPLLKFDPAGRLLQTWGADELVWPHGLHIDRDGFIWVSDARAAGGRGHQVFKLSAAGEIVLTLGVAGTAGDGEDLLDGPTDIAVASNGDIFVADGHGNNRVVKYSPAGEFLMAWGQQGAAPGEFDVPHAIAIDSRDRIYVGDRDNGRIQIFDQNGRFLEAWTQFGAPSGMYLAPGDILWVAHASGVRAGSTRTGAIAVDVPYDALLAEEGNVEDVAADASGAIYAGLAGPWTLVKLAPQN
jgi:streptogramin lyase